MWQSLRRFISKKYAMHALTFPMTSANMWMIERPSWSGSFYAFLYAEIYITLLYYYYFRRNNSHFIKINIIEFCGQKKRISINQKIGFSRNTVIRSTQRIAQLDQTPNHILNDCPAQRRFSHFILTIEYDLVHVDCPSLKFIHTDFFRFKNTPFTNHEGGTDISKSMWPKNISSLL